MSFLPFHKQYPVKPLCMKRSFKGMAFDKRRNSQREQSILPMGDPLSTTKNICTFWFRWFLGLIRNVDESESGSVVSESLWPCGLQSASLLHPSNFPGQNTEVGSCSLLQGMFSTQVSNPDLLHGRQILYHLSHQGNPRTNTQRQALFEVCELLELNESYLWLVGAVPPLWVPCLLHPH